MDISACVPLWNYTWRFENVETLCSRCCSGCGRLFIGSRTCALEIAAFPRQKHENIGCVCVPTVTEVRIQSTFPAVYGMFWTYCMRTSSY